MPVARYSAYEAGWHLIWDKPARSRSSVGYCCRVGVPGHILVAPHPGRETRLGSIASTKVERGNLPMMACILIATIDYAGIYRYTLSATIDCGRCVSIDIIGDIRER